MVQVMVAVSADEEKLEMFNVNHLVNPLLRSKKLEASIWGGAAHSSRLSYSSWFFCV